jgi:hypothetical protein
MKNLIFGIVIGVLLSCLCGLGGFFYTLNKKVQTQGVTLAQVVAFLNEQIQKTPPAVK